MRRESSGIKQWYVRPITISFKTLHVHFFYLETHVSHARHNQELTFDATLVKIQRHVSVERRLQNELIQYNCLATPV